MAIEVKGIKTDVLASVLLEVDGEDVVGFIDENRHVTFVKVVHGVSMEDQTAYMDAIVQFAVEQEIMIALSS